MVIFRYFSERNQGLYVYQFNVYTFFTMFVLSIIRHQSEAKANDKAISSLLQKLSRKPCFFHIVIVKEKVLTYLFWLLCLRILKNEPKIMRLHKKFKLSSCFTSCWVLSLRIIKIFRDFICLRLFIFLFTFRRRYKIRTLYIKLLRASTVIFRF